MVDERSADARDGLTYRLRRQLFEGSLADRPSIACITLLLTYRCPAACDHCVFESDKTRTETLDPEVARRFIEAAARQAPPPAISFSGGEPFLALATMRSLMEHGLAHGMRSEVVTSCAWVRDQEHARTVLSELVERGLGSLCVSFDRFHAPFVDARRVRDAVLTGLDVGLRVIINTAVDPRAPHDERAWLATALELSPAQLERCFVNRLVTVPVGRARQRGLELYYPHANAPDPSQELRHGCAFSTEVITLSPRGLLYPCCGSVVGEDPEKAGLYVQDDLAERSVDEIAALLGAIKQDLFFKLLQSLGPYRLLEEVRKANPGLVARTRFTSACDACLEFTSNPAVTAATRRLLLRYAERLAATPTD